MSMRTQLKRKLEPDAVARAKNKGGIPEFIRKKVQHQKAKLQRELRRTLGDEAADIFR